MNEVTIKDDINVEDMIYEIRGKQVMLDSDLAKLYECKNGTKEINQAVKNNPLKFPERFSWNLNDEEAEKLLVKIFDQKKDVDFRGGRYKNPRVFTEQGVAMLATILKSKIATEVSIRIMDAFVAMRHYIGNNLIEQKYINDMVISHDSKIKKIESVLDKFEEKKRINEIYFNGQTYDAYSRIIDIMKEASKDIVIIDSYVDKSLLDMISKININIILITKENNKLSNLDIDKYNSEYHNLKVIYNDNFHDRYIVIDNNTIYHLGTSINHAGKKIFSINNLTDKFVKDSLIKEINKIIN